MQEIRNVEKPSISAGKSCYAEGAGIDTRTKETLAYQRRIAIHLSSTRWALYNKKVEFHDLTKQSGNDVPM